MAEEMTAKARGDGLGNGIKLFGLKIADDYSSILILPFSRKKKKRKKKTFK
jgi:hypothetical protein